MQIKIAGRVRGFFAGNYPENDEDQQFHVNNRGDQLIAQGLPERSELVRMGASWGAQIPTASAFTYVAAWPTTRAELVLCNAEDKGGKSYLIDRAWLANISATATGNVLGFLGQLVPAALNVAAATDNAAILRQSLSGKLTNYNGRATLALANTAFAIANRWVQLGNSTLGNSATTIGLGCEALLYGRIIVPPGAAFCLAALTGTAAGTAICGMEWHEVQIPGL